MIVTVLMYKAEVMEAIKNFTVAEGKATVYLLMWMGVTICN